MVIVMPPGSIGSPAATPTGQIGAVLPTMLNVVIVAGQTAKKTVVIGGPTIPDEFDESDFDLFDLDPEGGHPQAAAAMAAPGASRSASVVLAARAVMEMPGLGLALNNFGAILRLLGEITDSVVVLRAAREVDPESPMILTNLANSVRELGDLRLAESLYLEALRARDDFGPALSALGEIYMARGDYEKAIDMLMRGSEMGFCAAVSDSLVDALDEAYGDSDQVPPRPPTGTTTTRWHRRLGWRPWWPSMAIRSWYCRVLATGEVLIRWSVQWNRYRRSWPRS